MTGAPIHTGRLRLMALLFLTGWAVLFYRLTDIQILRSAFYRERAQHQHHHETVLEPRRGEIVDREGRPLAVDRLLHTVGVHPRYVEDAGAVADMLTRLVGSNRSHWLREIQNHDGFFYVARRVDLKEEPPLSHLLPQGLEVTETFRRTYPGGALASVVLGHTGVDGKGMEGVELQYEEMLHGRPGRLVQQVDATGAPIPGREIVREEPVNGISLRLTLDAVVQEVLEEELAVGIEESEAKGGLAVALDPRTFAVLAMTSWPSYDPNNPDGVEADCRRNRVVTDPFEPGSVLKIVTFAAALDAGRYTPADTVDGGDGVIEVVGSEIKDTRPHGMMSLGEVLQYSSNVGTVKIARELGKNRIYRYSRDFGFGQATGLDLPGEAPGVLRKIPEWYGPALESLSIGYGISVTALQVAAAYAAVANSGRLMQPYLVESVMDRRGRWRSVGEPQFVRRVMHGETAALLQQFLLKAVASGTGDMARVVGMEIAGKTGTARKAGVGGYETGSYISSFCGFLPAHEPEFLLLIVVDEPANSYYAREVAAPIFSRTVRRLICHPDQPLQGVQSSLLRVVDRPPPIVPDLRRLPAAEAGKALTRRGLRVRYVGTGTNVLSQEPEPMCPVEEGQVVVLHLESPSGTDSGSLATIPDLKGRSLREAAAEASALGLVLSVEGSGLIWSQDPLPGSEAKPGSNLRVRARKIGGSG